MLQFLFLRQPLLKFFKVKHLFIVLTLFFSVEAVIGQAYISSMSDDSSRSIELKNLNIKSIQKSSQQQLIQFYKYNHAATLEEILSHLPEISLTRRGSYGMDPGIRSFSSGQTNLLLDGMRIHGACTDKMDPASIYIEPINLENLQVQTGATGFVSGSSIGGNINLKIAEPSFEDNKKVRMIINSGYQSAAKSFYEAVQFNYAKDKWAILTSGTFRKNHNYRSGGGHVIAFSQFNKVNYSLAARYKINPSLILKADFIGDDGWNIGYPALPMDVGYANARIGALSLSQQKETGHFKKWQAKLYANLIRHSMDDSKRPHVPIHMDMPGKSITYGGYFEGEIHTASNSKIQIKADAFSNTLKASMTMYQHGQLPMYMQTWPENRKNQIGFGAVYSIAPDSSLRIEINTRADYILHQIISSEGKNQLGIFGFNSSTRKNILKNFSVQLFKKITSPLRFSGSFGYSERAGTASELFGFYLFNNSDGFDYIGNPELRNEKALQAEITGTVFYKKIKVSLTTFYTCIYNYIMGEINPAISPMTIGAKGVKTYTNMNKAFISGLEATATIKPIQHTELVSTLKYNNGRDDAGQALPMMAPLKSINSFRWQTGKVSFQIESEAAAKQKRISVKSGEDVTPGFVLFHFRSGFSLFEQNLQIQYGIENLFDKKYYEHLDWGNIYRPGRNIYLQMKLVL